MEWFNLLLSLLFLLFIWMLRSINNNDVLQIVFEIMKPAFHFFCRVWEKKKAEKSSFWKKVPVAGVTKAYNKLFNQHEWNQNGSNGGREGFKNRSFVHVERTCNVVYVYIRFLNNNSTEIGVFSSVPEW